jgi:hypothetical protein
MSRQLLFSVTASDCEFTYTRGIGPGGQKRNKTSSAVHCHHLASGARSYSDITRSQHDNKRDAFKKMVNTDVFKKWHRLEVLRRLGTLSEIETKVDYELRTNLKIEIRENDKWIEVENNYDRDMYE